MLAHSTDPQIIIIEKLTEHVASARNVPYDRDVFHSTGQKGNEPVEQFVVRLRQLAGPCTFGMLLEAMMRDHQVLRCCDEQAQTRLFHERDCDLTKVISPLHPSLATATQLRLVVGTKDIKAEDVNYTSHQNNGR